MGMALGAKSYTVTESSDENWTHTKVITKHYDYKTEGIYTSLLPSQN